MFDSFVIILWKNIPSRENFFNKTSFLGRQKVKVRRILSLPFNFHQTRQDIFPLRGLKAKAMHVSFVVLKRTLKLATQAIVCSKIVKKPCRGI